MFNSNEDQRYCRLEKDEQILKPKIRGRELVISEFVFPFHGSMVDPDTVEPSWVMLKYVNKYGVYRTGEDFSKKIEEVCVTFLKLRGGAMAL